MGVRIGQGFLAKLDVDGPVAGRVAKRSLSPRESAEKSAARN